MLTRVELVAGDRVMLLRPRDGIGTVELDWGFPEVRAQVQNRTDNDGSIDTTEYFGASAVSMTLKLYRPGTTRAIIDELNSFRHPALRPYLVVDDDEWSQPRRIMLRADQQAAPIAAGQGALRQVQVGWKAPDGVWETNDLVEELVTADVSGTTGRSYPRVHPWSYTTSMASGATTVTNLGGTPSHFHARLYGPCSAPSLINLTTGQQLTFTSGLVLSAGEYVEISTRDQTAYLLSISSASRLTLLNFDLSNWWRIEPGEQQVRYAPDDVAAGAAAVITYRPAWL
jgi:hypothetical protein